MKHKYPKISIVTASLNSGKFIEDSIKSVLRQNYENFEHIIIDGGSTDGTIEILKKYPHLKWISEQDKGQSDALNKGFKIADGDIIGWLNADEYYLPKTFNTVSKEFVHFTPDIIYGEIYYADTQMNLIRRKYDHPFDKRTFLFTDCIISTAASFFSRRIFDENNFLDINYKASMDYDFFCGLAVRNYKFHFISQPLSVFRLTGENYGGKHKEFWRKEIRQTKEKYTDLPLKGTIFFNPIAYLFKHYYSIKRLFLKMNYYGISVILSSRLKP